MLRRCCLDQRIERKVRPRENRACHHVIEDYSSPTELVDWHRGGESAWSNHVHPVQGCIATGGYERPLCTWRRTCTAPGAFEHVKAHDEDTSPSTHSAEQAASAHKHVAEGQICQAATQRWRR